jgi:hypothetical protein
MALPDLTGLNIEDTYQRVLHTDGTNIYDGTGSLINVVETGSFASTSSNVFNGTQTINGDVNINGTASIAFLNVAIESASIIYSSGSNQLGDAANDTQTLYGNVIVPTGSLTITGNISASGDLFVGSTNQVHIGDDLNETTAPGKLKLYTSGVDGFLTTYQYNSILDLKAGVSGSGFANSFSRIRLQDNFGGSGFIGFHVSGSERMRITNTGNVGIGTANPTLPLQITSGSNTLSFDPTFARISSGDANVQLFAGSQNIFRGLDNWAGTWNDGATTTYFQTGRQAGNTAFSTYLGTAYNRIAFITSRFQITNLNAANRPPTNYFQIDVNNTNLFSVANSASIASVGINNISPSASLHISGASSAALLEIDSPAVNNILFVSGSGRVGIGTGTPGYTLDVSGSARFNGRTQFGTNSSFWLDPFIASDPTWGGSFKIDGGVWLGASGQKARVGNYITPIARLEVQGLGSTSATQTFRLDSSTTNLMTVLDNGQYTFRSPTITLATSQSAFWISQSISQSAVIGAQVYGVNITPTFFANTASQTETAFRVAATFTGSAAATGGTNIIADLGATSAGSQFTVTDVTSGSIYMVNDVSGLPIIEATSDWTVNMYNFPNKVFEKRGNNVNIYGTLNATGSFILPLSQSISPQTGSAYWSGSFLFVYDGTRYRSSSFA